MNIHDFTEKFRIKQDDLKKHLKLEKKLKMNIFDHKGCFNCGDTINYSKWPAEEWSHVHVCHNCKRISIAFEQDRMSGAHSDTIEVYKEKN